MKKHAEKALSHEVSVLGKTVPTVAIAALLLIGGGSAAVLTSFGTVTGSATVDQAVTVNGVDADNGAFSQSYSFSTGTPPYTFSDSATVENNLDTTTAVDFVTSTTSPGDTDDSNVESGGFDTGYMFLHNGTTFSNVRGSGSATAEYVYRNGRAVVHAYGSNPSGGANEAGLRFTVDHEFTRDNTVTVDAVAGEDNEQQVPDWIKYRVTLDQEITLDDGTTYSAGTEFYVSDVTVDAGEGENTLTDSQDGDAFGDFIVYEMDEGSYEQSDVSVSDLTGSSTIEDLIVATGDGADANSEFDMYYRNVDFNGEDLTKSFGTSTTPVTLDVQSTSEFGVANSLDVYAYPGTYSVTTDVEPQTQGQ